MRKWVTRVNDSKCVREEIDSRIRRRDERIDHAPSIRCRKIGLLVAVDPNITI
jgi:hypothetical protein